MTFEEEFPNLVDYKATLKQWDKKFKEENGKLLAITMNARGANYFPDFACFQFVPTYAIKTYCVEKQKINKVIDSIKDGLFSGRNWRKILKKELGL